MTRSAIVSLKSAKLCAAGAVALALAAAPAWAQNMPGDQDTTVGEVAMTPLDDLNLTKDPIPPILLQAVEEPYASPPTQECEDIRVEIGDLDAVLGDDYDTAPPADRSDVDAGGIVKRIVGWLIPYRGIIREVSGANKHEWEFRQAIAAGLMRRAYLKGLGEARECPYPARPASPELRAELAQIDQEDVTGYDDPSEHTGPDGTVFRSEAVVQATAE